MIATLMLTLALAVRLDAIWKVIRRAGGIDQRDGVLSRIFMVTAIVAALAFGVLVPDHRGTRADAGPEVKRLFDRYRQFQALPPDEVSRELRERRDEERAREVVFVPELDLGRTAWHEPPHPEAVNAATFALRRRMNAYPDPAATEVRELAAERHGVRPDAGRGRPRRRRAAAGRVRAAARGCGELLVAWPGWRPLPDLAQRAGGAAGRRCAGLDALARARREPRRGRSRSRAPTTPRARPSRARTCARCASACGERVWVLLDEAFADFLEPGEDAAPLVAELPNLLVFRTFAKAHAMAGFRIGYVLAPTAELAERLTPSFCVNAPAQAAAAWALELGDPVLARRRAAAARERERLARALHGTSLSFPPTAAPFVWLSSETHDGAAIAQHLGVRRILVAPRRALGRRAARPHHAARRGRHRSADRGAARAGLTRRTSTACIEGWVRVPRRSSGTLLGSIGPMNRPAHRPRIRLPLQCRR